MNGRAADAGTHVDGLAMRARSDATTRETSFEQTFLEHYPRVVRIIGRVVSDQARAEQLAADVFWKLFRRGPGRFDQHVGAWLYRAALTSALDALRVAGRRNRYEAAAALEAAGRTLSDDPLGRMLVEERRAQVRATLGRLKRREARLLLLRAAGLAYDEIARTLGLNPRSVGTLLNRAEAAFEEEHRKST
jgi:RNA polymerase sigma-70 factor (ECF subfamily)